MKKNVVKKATKLTLSRETLRALDPQRASEVQGGTTGTSWFCSRTCESACDFCPN